MRARRLKELIAICVVAATGIAAAQEGLAAPDRVDPGAIFEVGYSADLFFDVEPSDARAATKVWIEYFVDKVGEDVASETAVLDGVTTIVSRLNEKTLDLAVLLPEDYLRVAEQCELEPILVTTRAKRSGYEYGLFVRRDADLTRLADLEGAEIIIERGDKGSVPRAWLEQLLRQRALPPGSAFTGKITQVGRVAKAVLPVFFGDVQACLVNMESFALMEELNPQLGRELLVLEKSASFCRALICLRPDVKELYGGLLRESMRSLHTEPQGQQLLGLFHVDELVPFEPAHLRAVKELIDRGGH